MSAYQLSLAEAMAAQEKYDVAITLAEHALEIRKGETGANHHDLARCFELLADFHTKLGKEKQGEDILNYAHWLCGLAMARRRLPYHLPDHRPHDLSPMLQAVNPGYVPALRCWFWCDCAADYPTKLLFETCHHVAHSAAARAEREGGEVVVAMPGGEVRRKVFERFEGDNGLRVVGAALL